VDEDGGGALALVSEMQRTGVMRTFSPAFRAARSAMTSRASLNAVLAAGMPQ
jgi:hypothetical protein